jgi:hypothetical protein
MLLAMALLMGTAIAAPMTPKEIEEIMRNLSAPKVAHTLPVDHDQGEDLLMRMLQRLKLYRRSPKAARTPPEC